ncbi:MAG: type III pantothenate kinase, partial [bacterium]|nr:type III pantothenate kinase [bacterium]
MLITIDIGNTNVVIGIYQQTKLIAHWRLSSQIARTGDECWILIHSLFESHKIKIKQARGAIISSVVPNLTSIFIQVFEEYFKITPVVVSADLNLELKILYDNPRAVGADRICNAVAG